MTIQSLKPDYLHKMWEAFHLAFANYAVPFQLSETQFHDRFVRKLHISYTHSPGMFDKDRLVAFIFVALNDYQGKKTCYNGGTGVIPNYRGQKISQKLYDYITNSLAGSGIERYLLEVITSNDKALKTYLNLGFETTRLFRCYRHDSTATFSKQEVPGLEIRKAKFPQLQDYLAMQDTVPSFIDASQHLVHHLDHELVLEASLNGQLAGYIIFQQEPGRISQFGVHPQYRHQGIGTALLKAAKNRSIQKGLTVLNVDETQNAISLFLTKNGFTEMLQQHEMELVL